jgi:hypothetical protein
VRTKRKSISPKPDAKAEGEALDALNVRMCRRGASVRLIEANIEAKAKKRRRQEVSTSSALRKL